MSIGNTIIHVLQNGIDNNYRSLFVITGSKALESIPIILQDFPSSDPLSILWCSKKGQKDKNSSKDHSKKDKSKKETDTSANNNNNNNNNNHFSDFIPNSKIKFCSYRDSSKVLGQTYQILILQDFSEITPNILARTVETISGGGIIFLVLPQINDIKDLSTIPMSFDTSLYSEIYGNAFPRFSKRFLRSLTKCHNCLIFSSKENGELELINQDPILSDKPESVDNEELKEVKEKVSEIFPVGPIVNNALTNDQSQVILQIFTTLKGYEQHKIIGVTAARGRGKSAALGLSLACAIGLNYSNLFVTAPSPDNLKTLFEFFLHGLDSLGISESQYRIITSNTFHNQILRIEINRNLNVNSNSLNSNQTDNNNHYQRQTLSYISPDQFNYLGQCEILAIDEAAAIPLPSVRKLLGPYVVLLASTVNGYEGTGRALSIKLFDELRKKVGSVGGRIDSHFIEVNMTVPIRYSLNDPIESWLFSLLALDAQPEPIKSMPAPNNCTLFQINRAILFSEGLKEPAIEKYLRSLISISIGSHYKNQPDDLMLAADSPAHRLFTLLSPPSPGQPPFPIVYLQVVLEGKIDDDRVKDVMNRSESPPGNLVPWILQRNFSEFTQKFSQSDRISISENPSDENDHLDNIAGLSGVRIVRLAVHPMMQGKGYGSRAMEQFLEYYSGQIPQKSANNQIHGSKEALFWSLDEVAPEYVDYASVSFGLTKPLFRFWKKLGFSGVHLSQTTNSSTGEFSCIVIKGISENGEKLSTIISPDFAHRLISLLSFNFRSLPTDLALELLSSFQISNENSMNLFNSMERIESQENENSQQIKYLSDISPEDIDRLQRFYRQQIGFPRIEDLIQRLSIKYFQYHLIKLSKSEESILVAIGLQRKTLKISADDHKIQINQVMTLLQGIVKKFLNILENKVDTTKQRYKIVAV